MSAIWGMVDFQKESGTKELARRLKKPYDTYRIDIYNNYVAKNVVFGYGGQYFTKEAENEILPIVDDGETVFFVADAVLDNRGELFDLLDIRPEGQSEISDGTLMYQILRKFKKQSYNLFLGSYAFVYYDKDMEEVILVADAVGSRSLYYKYDQEKLYFSTLMKPILEVCKDSTEWNYRFLSCYLTLNSLILDTNIEETPYHNLYKVAPGQAISIKKESIYKEEYWKLPLKTKRLRKSDEDFKKEFLTLFDQCVQGVMRSSGKTGILLSGGLDSTSVACFAAPILKSEGKQLYSYTSIPEKDYVTKENSYYETNEKKLVEITRDYLENVSSTFLELSGENAFDGSREYMEKYELPYKTLQNIRWLHESAKKSAEDGCHILLTGQFGNSTISFGEFEMYFYSLLKAGRFIELWKEVNAFHSKFHSGRKRVYKRLFKNLILSFQRNKLKVEDLFANVYVNPELTKRYSTKKSLIEDYSTGNIHTCTFRTIRPNLVNKNSLMQIGELETHLSLTTGVLLRDPTRDRRLIEYCMKLPENQFVFRGVERRLVKEYLESYIPKEIIMHKHKGLQSADMVHRIAKNWPSIYQECVDLLKEDMADILLDLPKVKDKLESYKENLPTEDKFEVMKFLYSILLVKYVKVINL